MFGAIGEKKLISRSDITTNFEKYAMNIIRCGNQRIIYAIGLQCMFVRHRKSIVDQLVKFILPDVFVTDVNAAIKCRKVDIYPPGILCCLPKETAVLHDLCVDRIFKGVGVTWPVENLVLLFRELYFEITPGLRSIVTITGGS
jgi:hypothetical protein